MAPTSLRIRNPRLESAHYRFRANHELLVLKSVHYANYLGTLLHLVIFCFHANAHFKC